MLSRWLKRIFLWHGHLVLWSVALIALFWLVLVLTLQFLGSRPQSLYTLAEMAGVQLEIGQFSANTRPLASAVDIALDKVKLSWIGGQLEIDHVEGDINLWNLLTPDLAVGKKMRIHQLKLVLDTEAQTASVSNPLANPWLRLWEDTAIDDSQVVWQADAPWMLNNIEIKLSRQAQWEADFKGIMHYPGWPETPVTAQATISHQFGFHPKIQFKGSALPGNMVLLGQHYDFKFALQGNWNAQDLQADLTIDANSQGDDGQQLTHHVLGHLHSDDLLMWDMSVQQLSVGSEKIELPVWPRLTVHPQTGAVLVLNQVRLAPDGSWLKSMPADVQQAWQLWQPELWLNQLSLHWGVDGGLDAIRGGVDLLRWTPTQGIPGMDLRQLTFDYHPKDGRLAVIPLGERNLLWQFANGQTLPITADPLVLRLNPDMPFSDWSIPSWQIHVGDVSVSIIADVHADKPMQLQLALTAAKLSDVIHLLPMDQFSEPLQNWLKVAFKEGKDIQGAMRFNGELSQLLSGQLTDDNFVVTAQAKGVTLQYDKDYPPLTQTDALLSWRNHSLIIESKQAHISGGLAEDVKAEVLYLPNNQIALRVNGQIKADLGQVRGFLLASPLAKDLDVVDVLKNTKLAGAASGRLSLWIPLDGFDGAASLPRVRGMMSTQAATLDYGMLSLSSLSGKLLFSETALDSPELSGQWQGGDVQARILTQDKGQVSLKLTASTPMNQVAMASGFLDWRADVSIANDGKISAQITGNQKRLALTLPEPFYKKQGQERPWQLQVSLVDGLIQTRFNDEKWRMDARIKATQTDWQWQSLSLVSRDIKAKSSQSAIDIQLAQASLDDWLSWLDEVSGSDAKIPLPEQGQLSIARLTFSEQSFDQLEAKWQIGADKTEVQLQSPQVSGQLLTTNTESQLRLDKLFWQRRVKPVAEKLTQPLPVCQKPTQKPWHPLRVDIALLNLETTRQEMKTLTSLSNLHGLLMQEGKTRRIKDIQLQSGSLKASGAWEWNLSENKSNLFFKARADKAADMTALWGLDNIVRGGSADIEAMLSWDGGLDCLDTRLLRGDLKLRADDGALSDTSPGLARLFGLLSFDAFTRRLKIGLGDVVNQGLAYDKIEATAALSKGVLQLNHLQLDGPSVRMVLKGNTDLVGEEHELDAAVTPLVGDSIPTMALLSGVSPITAIGVYLLQKIVPPLSGNLFTFDYHITGGWQDPVLTEVVHGQDAQ
jgi:uncharacterized protein YhdP